MFVVATIENRNSEKESIQFENEEEVRYYLACHEEEGLKCIKLIQCGE